MWLLQDSFQITACVFSLKPCSLVCSVLVPSCLLGITCCVLHCLTPPPFIYLYKTIFQRKTKCHKTKALKFPEGDRFGGFLTGFENCSAFKWDIYIKLLMTVHPQPASSSDSEGSNAGGGSDEDDDEEEAIVPQKAQSRSDVDSDSGSEDTRRGGGAKRKPGPAKVNTPNSWFSISFLINNYFIREQYNYGIEVNRKWHSLSQVQKITKWKQ